MANNSPEQLSTEAMNNFAQANLAQATHNAEIAERFDASDVAQTPAQQLDSARLFAHDPSVHETGADDYLRGIDNVTDPQNKHTDMLRDKEATEIRSFKDIISDIKSAENPGSEHRKWITKNDNVSKRTKEIQLPVDQSNIDDLYEQLAMAVVSKKKSGKYLNEDELLEVVERLGSQNDLNVYGVSEITSEDRTEVSVLPVDRTWNQEHDGLLIRVAELSKARRDSEVRLDNLNVQMANILDSGPYMNTDLFEVFTTIDDEGNEHNSDFHKSYNARVHRIVMDAPNPTLTKQLQNTANEKFNEAIIEIRLDRAEAVDAKLNKRTITDNEAYDQGYDMTEDEKNDEVNRRVLPTPIIPAAPKPADATPKIKTPEEVEADRIANEQMAKNAHELSNKWHNISIKPENRQKDTDQGKEAALKYAKNLAQKHRQSTDDTKFEDTPEGRETMFAYYDYTIKKYDIKMEDNKITDYNDSKINYDIDIRDMKNTIRRAENGLPVANLLRNIRGKLFSKGRS